MLQLDCNSCKRFAECKNPKKGFGYMCNRFRACKTVRQPSQEELDIREEELEELDEAMGFDLVKSASHALTSKTAGNSLVRPDLKVDDRDLVEYPNFYTFATDPSGLNLKPWPKQAAVGTFLFGEWCPACSNPRWAKLVGIPRNIPLQKFQENFILLEHGICPKCHKNKRQLLKEKARYFHFYHELVGCAGQRSGKSAEVGMFAAYVTHRYLKLQKPAEVYSLLSSSVLSATFLGIDKASANELLWLPFTQILTDSPWFQAYRELLQYYANQYGEELYREKDTYMVFKHRNMRLFYAAPSKAALRGRTRFMYGIDELGWFDNSEDTKVRNADEVYKALDRSCLTIRKAARSLWKQGNYNVPTAYAFNISSPRSVFDKIMSLLKAHENSKRVFAFHAPTWELHPTITKKDLAEDFAENPIKAMRDYGAEPPLSRNPFFSSYQSINGCIRADHPYKNSIKAQQATHYSDVEGTLRWAKLQGVTGPYRNTASIMALDAGYCVSGDTYIMSNLGILRMDTLLPPDAIQGERYPVSLKIGSHGKPGKVKYAIYSGQKMVWKVSTKDGGFVKATESHQFMVSTKDGFTWKQVKDLQIGDPLCRNPDIPATLAKGKLNPLKLAMHTRLSHRWARLRRKKEPVLQLLIHTSPELGFIIGALLAEGAYNRTLGITTPSIQYIRKFEASMYSVFHIKPYSNEAMDNTYKVRYQSAQVQNWLKELGVFPSDGGTGNQPHPIPQCIMVADTLTQRAFLAAYLEGNGSLHERLTIEMWASPVRLTQLQLLIQAQGALAGITGYDSIRTLDTLSAWTLYEKISPYLTGTPVIWEKPQTLPNLGYSYTEITSIEKIGMEKVYDLCMDANSEPAFLANGLVVHNSHNSWAICIGGYDFKHKKPVIFGMYELMPQVAEVVDHSRIATDFVYPLLKQHNVVYLAADRWENHKLRHDVRDKYHIESEQYSLRRDDIINVKSWMNDGSVILPTPEMPLEQIQQCDLSDYPGSFSRSPISHFMLQCYTVEDTGKQVVKGETTDDLFRAYCLCIHLLLEDDIQDRLKVAVSKKQENRVIGVRLSESGSYIAVPQDASVVTDHSGHAIGVKL